MTNRKAKQKQESRQAIQASAAALLRERGIKASSVMDVMKGAGLTVGGFYNHFDSKEDLFVEVLQNASRANWNNLLKSARGDSPRARAMSVIRQYLSRHHRDCKDTGCLVPGAAAEVARARRALLVPGGGRHAAQRRVFAGGKKIERAVLGDGRRER